MNKDSFQTIRYMGTKTKLLPHIVPAILAITPKNGVVCDIMAGSNAVAYSLKEYFTLITNDIQEYSYVISVALIENQSEVISSNSASEILFDKYIENRTMKKFNLFERIYSDTYFSREQCQEIDSIRYAISLLENIQIKCLYLTALMGAMSKVQSTPGHFAQFMPQNHIRILPLREMSVWENFLEKCNLYSNVRFTSNINKCFCADFHMLIKDPIFCSVDTIYLDSPYTQEQYSRFYHVLETLVKYDYPDVEFKAKYRRDRFKSQFCYANTVVDEFRTILDFCQKMGINLVISYSNKGVLVIEQLLELCRSYSQNVSYVEINYSHSTQGKGSNKTIEYIISIVFKESTVLKV